MAIALDDAFVVVAGSSPPPLTMPHSMMYHTLTLHSSTAFDDELARSRASPTSVDRPIIDILEVAVGHSATSITLTTTTDVLAFLTGLSSVNPAIRVSVCP